MKQRLRDANKKTSKATRKRPQNNNKTHTKKMDNHTKSYQILAEFADSKGCGDDPPQASSITKVLNGVDLGLGTQDGWSGGVGR